jgi:hypothetical protein
LCFRTIKISSAAFVSFVSEPSKYLPQLSYLLFQNHQEIFHSFCFRTIKRSFTALFQNHQEIFHSFCFRNIKRSFTRLTTSRGLTRQCIWNSDLCYKDYPSCSCCANIARSIAATFGNCSSTMCGFVEHFKPLLEGL